MFWEVAYYDGQLPLRFINSEDNSVQDIEPENVIWIDILVPGQAPWGAGGQEYSMRLAGADIYYIDIKGPSGLDFGILNEDEQTRQDFTWTSEKGFAQVKDRNTEPGHTLYGVTIPDDEAREIGIL